MQRSRPMILFILAFIVGWMTAKYRTRIWAWTKEAFHDYFGNFS